MQANVKVTAVFEPAAGGGYVAYVEEIPGVNTQGETLKKARENLREALGIVLEVRQEMAGQQQIERNTISENV